MVNSEPEYRAANIEAKALTEFCDKADEVKKEWKAGGWFLPSVPWWDRPGQHLAHRVPVQAEHPGGLPNAHTFHHAPTGGLARTAPRGTFITPSID